VDQNATSWARRLAHIRGSGVGRQLAGIRMGGPKPTSADYRLQRQFRNKRVIPYNCASHVSQNAA
jgi:hypothetical protein